MNANSIGSSRDRKLTAWLTNPFKSSKSDQGHVSVASDHFGHVAVANPCGELQVATQNALKLPHSHARSQAKTFSEALEQGNYAAFAALVDKKGASNLNALTEALKPAVEAGDGQAVDILLSAGANGFADPDLQNTAARLGHESVVRAYLKQGFSVEPFITTEQKVGDTTMVNIIAEHARGQPSAVEGIVKKAIAVDAPGVLLALERNRVKLGNLPKAIEGAIAAGSYDCLELLMGRLGARGCAALLPRLFRDAQCHYEARDKVGKIWALLLRQGVPLDEASIYVPSAGAKGQQVRHQVRRILDREKGKYAPTKAVEERETLARIVEQADPKILQGTSYRNNCF